MNREGMKPHLNNHVARSYISSLSGKQRRFLTVNGSIRCYRLHLPVSCRPDTALPLVMNLHGMGSDAREQARVSGMSRQADARGFIVVYPEAQGSPPCWRIQAQGADIPDLIFMRVLLTHLRGQLCIDHHRIYVTGLSNGAGMANRMACDMADTIAAVGLVSGAYPRWNGCGPSRPVPMIVFHGTSDENVPYEGLGLALPAIRSWAADWAVRCGCPPQPAITYQQGCVTGETWYDAMGRSMIVLYTIAGGRHTWPGSIESPLPLGFPAHFDATRMIWEFFTTHPMST
jgi:polyhydroxybutyrate depolymerase